MPHSKKIAIMDNHMIRLVAVAVTVTAQEWLISQGPAVKFKKYNKLLNYRMA
jgi:hypothetical protein